MRIRNIRLKSIESRRYIEGDRHPKQVRIDHNSTITQIHDIKSNQATVDFQYTAGYGPVGMIKLEGSLIYEDDNIKKIAIDWRNTRKMPNQVASRIHTAVMHGCGFASKVDFVSKVLILSLKSILHLKSD